MTSDLLEENQDLRKQVAELMQKIASLKNELRAEKEYSATLRKEIDEYTNSHTLCTKYKDLEKENAELKSENQKWKDGIALKDEEIGCIETDFNTFKSKAKEIIVTFLVLMQTFGYSPSMDKFITEAEQFLNSEVEK